MQEALGKDLKHAEVAPRRSIMRLVVLFVVIAVAVGAVIGWRRVHSAEAAGQADPAQQQGAGNRANRNARGGGAAVAVVVATARRQDLPVYLDGLGSAQAFNTVTVKTRIDGQLIEVDFKEGQDVKAGDLLAKIDSRPYEVALNQMRAVLLKDQAQLADVKRNAERDKQLVAQGVIPQQQADTQDALLGQLQAAVQADQAQVDNAALQVSYCQITAPIGGRVGLRIVDAGNMVHASDPNGLLVITQVQPIAVLFSLPEDNLPAVVAQMRSGTPLAVRAMSRDSGTELASGTLLTIDDQIDQTTGTFRLKAVFDNPQRTLWPLQFVNARLLLDVKKDAIVIPAAAVQTGSQGPFVYVVKPDSTVEIRNIKTGIAQADIISIQGISEGETIVTDGQDRLQAGTRVDAQSDARGGSTDAKQPGAGKQRTAQADATANPRPQGGNNRQGQQNNRQGQDGRQGLRAGGNAGPPQGAQ
jgi:membrane fusion protein, multidrug efflux system